MCCKLLRMVLLFCSIPALEVQMKDGLTRPQIPSTACTEIMRPHNSAITALWLDNAPTDSPKFFKSEQAKNVFVSIHLSQAGPARVGDSATGSVHTVALYLLCW